MKAARRVGSDGRLTRPFMLGVLAAAYAVFLLTYLPINELSVGRPAHVLFLPGEARIPFVPGFEFAYAAGYVFPLLLVWKPPRPADLPRIVVAFGLILAVAYATYLLFPVYFERPELVVRSPSTFLLSLEYLDPPYNHFPSLHVALACLVALACREAVTRPGLLLAGVGAVAVSTLFVKQHYVADVVCGAALAVGCWAVAGWWTAGDRFPVRAAIPLSSESPSPERRS